ncbi:LOW QUALITY PROTEIN: hypothetical protein BC936DRAFT_148272 [Jimgerdemannia flammicorona]|uniref:Uncharacterized protein n=1 Tax=Jimgerdemannia flammicorona TaxID=994334 RepID=A0A433D3K3_9FUNG|nr:LOW QUALITY PROTEIN: hypothetical protein BC936DRAFT_148272 [Jimgerdemannia flammicorona]
MFSQYHSSRIEGPTQKNRFGFKFSQNKSALAVRDRQHIDLFSVEVHGGLRLDWTMGIGYVVWVRYRLMFVAISINRLHVKVNTRGKLLPNPSEDPVSVIFWCLQTEGEDVQTNGYRKG